MKYVLLIFTDRHILKIDDFSIVYTVPQFIIMYILLFAWLVDWNTFNCKLLLNRHTTDHIMIEMLK